MTLLCEDWLPLLRRTRRYANSETMPTDKTKSKVDKGRGAADRGRDVLRPLTSAAERALAEAAARRGEHERKRTDEAKEVNGRGDPDPARYGDWEINGIASDF